MSKVIPQCNIMEFPGALGIFVISDQKSHCGNILNTPDCSFYLLHFPVATFLLLLFSGYTEEPSLLGKILKY